MIRSYCWIQISIITETSTGKTRFSWRDKKLK